MTKQNSKKIKRYHKSFYFPPWATKSLQNFSDSIRSRTSITFSLHALEKTLEYGFEYGRKFLKSVSKVIREDALKNGEVFEFYSIEQEIRKACFRVFLVGSPVDLILVISSDGVVITLYVSNKGDNHNTLDENLYEKGK